MTRTARKRGKHDGCLTGLVALLVFMAPTAARADVLDGNDDDSIPVLLGALGTGLVTTNAGLTMSIIYAASTYSKPGLRTIGAIGGVMSVISGSLILAAHFKTQGGLLPAWPVFGGFYLAGGIVQLALVMGGKPQRPIQYRRPPPSVNAQPAVVGPRGWLGVGFAESEAGVRVTRIVDGSPAAGILRPGDHVLQVADKLVRSLADIEAALRLKSAGDRVLVELFRDGGPLSVTVTLVVRPRSSETIDWNTISPLAAALAYVSPRALVAHRLAPR